MDELYKKLKFKSRRGMRELDLILQNYLENNYDLMSDDLKADLNKLLDLSDPKLWDLLVIKNNPNYNKIIIDILKNV